MIEVIYVKQNLDMIVSTRKVASVQFLIKICEKVSLFKRVHFISCIICHNSSYIIPTIFLPSYDISLPMSKTCAKAKDISRTIAQRP